MPIRVLPPEVASQIAAGEVVERPASAIKELIENSLDAGADHIQIETREGGRRLLRVSDNGQGIPAAEVALAFERHATSKLSSADDLLNVATLGFRGEALASIASVSQLTLLTRHVSESVGTRVRVEGGITVKHESKGTPPGTIVTVENLFYNVPARQKFLRRAATESRHISSIVQRLAMAFPERRLSLVSDGRLVFQSNGSGHLHDVLVKVLGLEAARQLVPLGFEDQRTSGSDREAIRLEIPDVHGFVGLPTLSRSNRNQILFFLNGRLIQDRSLTFAVTEAYRNRLMAGRNPVAVLMIDIDPAQVDVNVHPSKAEVRFRDERAVFRAVQKAVLATLNQHAPVPELSRDGLGWSLPGWAERRQSLIDAGQGQQPIQFEPARPAGPNWDPITPVSGEGESLDQQAHAQVGDSDSALGDASDVLPMLRVVGQMGTTYIVAEGPKGMYLIDQHAAHERVLFEQMSAQQANKGVPQQALLEPLAFETGTEQAGLIEEFSDALSASGFQIEPFGGDTWLVRAVPAVFGSVDPRRAVAEVLQGLADGRDLVGETKEEALVTIICKRAAIRGGQVLSIEEMRRLLQQLEACQNPGSCPHGRPTMLILSTDQLEREFGRRGA
ncbi:MAG: DNA mismatch repair endonuclease MutL [Chloroflexota bacterium]|nr:DNA mismatch repair endonuclease MutL [Chloroflexota bacterium]